MPLNRRPTTTGPRLGHHASSRSIQSSTPSTSPLLPTHRSNESNNAPVEVDSILSSIAAGGTVDDKKTTCRVLMQRFEAVVSEMTISLPIKTFLVIELSM